MTVYERFRGNASRGAGAVNALPGLLVIDPRDNVGTALRELKAGENVRLGAAPGTEAQQGAPAGSEALDVRGTPEACGGWLLLKQEIPAYHKAALTDIPAGRPVIKYGEIIGIALRQIRAGEHVHVHNLAGRRAEGPAALGGAV